jgi:hypothetical protein
MKNPLARRAHNTAAPASPAPTSEQSERGGYARVNLFVGAYRIPADGWLRLPGARIRYLHQIDDHEFVEVGSPGAVGPLWLIIEDEARAFWPVMARLEEPGPQAFTGAKDEPGEFPQPAADSAFVTGS